MSTPEVPTPVNVQESVISADLNASMLFNFLMGIYTMVYAGTMYLYISKPTNKGRYVVLSTVSVLYMLCLGIFIIGWYYLDLAVVVDGETRESTFLSTLEGGPTSLFAFSQFLFYSVFTVSDGLLIWRCYHVWDKSIRVIVAPSVLLLVELGFLVVITVMSALESVVTSSTVAAVGNGIITAQVFASLATTVIATSLIGYRIYSASRPVGALAKGRFTYIVTIIFESAAAYSLAILIYAISLAIPSQKFIGTPISNASYYIEVLVSAIAGMAPTILVARIALTSADNTVVPTITHISGLQFQSQQESGDSGSANEGKSNSSMQEGGASPQDEEKIIQ